MTFRQHLCIVLLLTAAMTRAGAQPTTAPTSPRDTALPFMLWNKADAADIRKLIETEPWAKQQYEREMALGPTPVRNLFKFFVFGDENAGLAEKETLIAFIGHPTLEKDTWDWQWHHADVWQHALRYEMLCDRLTPGQRKAVEDTFRVYGRFAVEGEPLRGFGSYGRHPGEHVLILPLRDQRLLRGLFAARGGVKDTLDGLRDGYFHASAFNHIATTTCHLMIWARACDRMGLGAIGSDYKGPNGGSLRRIFEGILLTGWPRTEIPGHPPYYGKLTLTPARFDPRAGYRDLPTDILPLPVVEYWGTNPSASASWLNVAHASYYAGDENISRMDNVLVTELAQQKWPDLHLDYFLVQLRHKGEDRYLPSIYWGLRPIGFKSAKAPAAPSGAYPQAGVAMLRADETPAYWESPAPAVAFQMATAHAGWTGGAFSIAGFHAFNRPIYDAPRLNRNDGSDWTPSGRSNSTVVVDNLQIGKRIENNRWVDASIYPRAIGEVPIRSGFDGLAKFVAARARPRMVEALDREKKPIQEELAIYPGVDFERGLILTSEYLFDVFHVTSDKPHDYYWIVHALGQPHPDAAKAWQSTDLLDKRLGCPEKRAPAFAYQDQKTLGQTDDNWSLSIVQGCALPDASKSHLGAAWYDRQIGVRVTMIGRPGTTVSTATPVELSRGAPPAEEETDPELPIKMPKANLEPGKAPTSLPFGNAETGHTMLAVGRSGAASATFVAIHEPFEGGKWRIDHVKELARAVDATLVELHGRDGSPVNDRVMIRLGDKCVEPITLDVDTGESFTFADRALVRVSADAIRVSGGLRAMRLKVEGAPKLIINDKEISPVSIEAGMLRYEWKPTAP